MAYENLKELYRSLMKEGYKLHEIDEMDIHFYFELQRESSKQSGPKRVSIDHVL